MFAQRSPPVGHLITEVFQERKLVEQLITMSASPEEIEKAEAKVPELSGSEGEYDKTRHRVKRTAHGCSSSLRTWAERMERSVAIK